MGATDAEGRLDTLLDRTKGNLADFLDSGDVLFRGDRITEPYLAILAQTWFARRGEQAAERSAQQSERAAKDAVEVAEKGVQIAQTGLKVNAIIGAAAVIVAVAAVLVR